MENREAFKNDQQHKGAGSINHMEQVLGKVSFQIPSASEVTEQGDGWEFVDWSGGEKKAVVLKMK